MTRHPFDFVSAFFGMVFTASALVVLITGDAVLGYDARWVWPASALVLGLLLLLSGLRPGRGRGTGT